MTYLDRVLDMPRLTASMIANDVRGFADGDAYARREATVIAAEADAEIARLRAALFQVSGYLNGALLLAGHADTTDAQAAVDHAAALLFPTPDAPA
jgi:hypothetical protein